MCGIACLINSNNSDNFSEELESFVKCISHRGPDGEGFSKFKNDMSPAGNETFKVGLGHRRLSILDLSEAGSQPMESSCGNYVISYNGEIYNYIELRHELEKNGSEFKSDCDTEVLLEAYRQWGKNCLKRFNGMWSFAILDKSKRQIFASRDRIGIKPLYFYKDDKSFALASEIKQFFQLKNFRKTPNLQAVLSYLASGYEIQGETFFENVYSFPPSSYALIDIDNPEIKAKKYWDADAIKEERYDEYETFERIKLSFSKAVELRLRSDVPVGGCLSGGLDSSAIFTEMKALNPGQHFSAFSACFDIPSIDERPFMKSVIEKTGSKHIRVYPGAKELSDDFAEFLKQHDEPVGSISMYAQYRVMKAAWEKKVPVLLDGQGGDELFSGYWPAYFLMLNYFKRSGNYFSILKHLTGSVMPFGNAGLVQEAFGHFSDYKRRASGDISFKIRDEHKSCLDSLDALSWHSKAQELSPFEYRKAEIFKVHLPRLLKWEDRNSMAFSIESRVPFLDVNLVEMLLSINPEKNMKNGWTKYLFRKAMSKRLPKNICWRKDKKGFETPQSLWMKKGNFHDFLLNWTSEKDHPVSEYVSTDFTNIRSMLSQGNFNPVSTFRLFCLDYWLKNIVS
jgi:asparagine synthase (glutamine-hydrolysing)